MHQLAWPVMLCMDSLISTIYLLHIYVFYNNKMLKNKNFQTYTFMQLNVQQCVKYDKSQLVSSQTILLGQ